MAVTKNKTGRRVIIAVTESSPLLELWQTAMQALEEAEAEVVALFLHDERWQRAASLPFTREVSKTGSSTNFTRQRADQVLSDTVEHLRKRMNELATGTGLTIHFEALPESEVSGTKRVVEGEENVLIAPADLTEHPVVSELKSLNFRIYFVESDR